MQFYLLCHTVLRAVSRFFIIISIGKCIIDYDEVDFDREVYSFQSFETIIFSLVLVIHLSYMRCFRVLWGALHDKFERLISELISHNPLCIILSIKKTISLIIYGRHGLSCSSSKGWIPRHNDLNNICSHAFSSAGIPNILQPPDQMVKDHTPWLLGAEENRCFGM